MENGYSIKADGSDRGFRRIMWNSMPAVAISPSPSANGMAEAESFVKIGNHLFSRGIPVPRIYEFDTVAHIIIVEDLGNTLLHSRLLGCLENKGDIGVQELYHGAIDMLITMQACASIEFDTSWCYDTSHYNADFAFEREGCYFAREFLQNLAGLEADPGLMKEVRQIADLTEKFTANIFLHRDFQSRNIMIKDNRLRVIDFQAGRLGPAGYDAASLIFDPYVPVSFGMRMELVEYFCRSFTDAGICQVSGAKMEDEVMMLGILRLMQALGAYAFLSEIKGRLFFRRHIGAALAVLGRLLDLCEGKRRFPFLYAIICRLHNRTW